MSSKEGSSRRKHGSSVRRKLALFVGAFILIVLFTLMPPTDLVAKLDLKIAVLLGVMLLWVVLIKATFSQLHSLMRLQPPWPEYQRLKSEVERLWGENKALRAENETLRTNYSDLSKRCQQLSDVLSSKEQELNILRDENEALRRSLEASDLAEWRRNVLAKANLSGRDYTIIYMLVKQADKLAESGYKVYARAILQAAYNLLQDRLVDRKLILLWEVGERPPADLQSDLRGKLQEEL